MYPADLAGIEDLADQPEIMCRGGSTIISPLGDVLAGAALCRFIMKRAFCTPTSTWQRWPKSKLDFDVVGHYLQPSHPNERNRRRCTKPAMQLNH